MSGAATRRRYCLEVKDDEHATPVGAAAACQRAALAAMVQQYQQPLGSYLIDLIGDRSVALAVAQETFVRAHQADLVNCPDRARGAWLYRVATRLAYSHLRQFRPARLPPQQLEPVMVGLASPKNRERAVVRSALSQLQPSERAVLLLCDLEQRPLDEAAVILGTSTSRLHHELLRARARFRLAHLASHSLDRSSEAFNHDSTYADTNWPRQPM